MSENLDKIKRAVECATLHDMRNASEVKAYALELGYSADECMAVCVRYGIHAGKAIGNLNAQRAYKMLREYKRGEETVEPSNLVLSTARLIDDPVVLHTLAAFMEGRAARLEAKALARELDGDQGDNGHDVNSDGNMEV